MKKEIIDLIEKKLGFVFKNKNLLIQAFTRKSFAEEQKVKGLDVQSNEQLEYFGDSVLNYLVVCGQFDHFAKVEDDKNLHVICEEDKLTEFNSHWTDKFMLSKCIDTLDIAQYLIMSKGDINQNINEIQSVKEDLFESIVGAMWIDSDRDISRIQSVVYNMLHIDFEVSDISKNYVSQLLEFADKNKYYLDKKIEEVDNQFKANYTLVLNILKADNTLAGIGYGKNIKEAEQNAAFGLIESLEQHGLYNIQTLPKMNYNLFNSINCLQELNQKGFIGEISYTDEVCFTTYKEPYWRVICQIKNYATTFVGEGISKKKAKKQAALEALNNIYSQQFKVNS